MHIYKSKQDKELVLSDAVNNFTAGRLFNRHNDPRDCAVDQLCAIMSTHFYICKPLVDQIPFCIQFSLSRASSSFFQCLSSYHFSINTGSTIYKTLCRVHSKSVCTLNTWEWNTPKGKSWSKKSYAPTIHIIFLFKSND